VEGIFLLFLCEIISLKIISFMYLFNRLSATAMLFFLTSFIWGQTGIPNSTPVTQNFDGMAATLSLPSNWRMAASTSSPTWAGGATTVTQQASTGAPSAGGTYNWGTSASERAVGAMTSGGFASPNNLLGYFENTGSTDITALTISYDAERYRVNSAVASVQFYYSLNGTSWTAVTAGDISASSFPTASSSYTFGTPTTVNKPGISITGLTITPSSKFYLRWNVNTTGSNSQGIGIDNISIIATFGSSAPTPTITPSPTTIMGLNYVLGSGPSVAQSFTIAVSNLTAGGGTITINGSTNYDVSTTSSTTGFGSSATLNYTGTGTLASNTVWVRLKAGLPIGNYNSQSIAISGGAATSSVTVSGSVTPPAPANDECSGAITLTPGAICSPISGTILNATQSLGPITCSSTTGTTPSMDVWYSFVATATSHNVSVTPDANFDAIIDVRSGLCNGVNIACADGSGVGATETVTVNGLSIGSTYLVRVYEYNGGVPSTPGFTICVADAPWEDFEPGVKTSYTAGNVTCTAGSWYMNDALIGTVAADKKNGSKSVRIQNAGIVQMNFDVTNGLSTVNILHAKYGTDGNSTWRLEASTDGGASWTAYTSPDITTSSATLVNQSFTLNLAGNVRFRIVKLAGSNRMNIDDIYIAPYNSPEINIKQASTNIPSGGSYNYGSLCETGSAQNIAFTIENTGSLPLSLTGPSPYVVLSGSGDFALTTTPSSPIAAAGSTTFNITFDPSSTGLKTATISIANDDSDENPYTFTVQGTGTAAVAPAISIAASPAGAICAGTSVTFTPTPSNMGGGTATYEWFKNNVSQGISATYTSNTLVNSDAIRATMTLAGGTCLTSGSASSNTINVVVNPIPAVPTGIITPTANPACGNTSLSYNNASPAIYWQTTASGTSTSNVSTTPYPITTSGTYYVRAYNGSCWSTSSLASPAITVNPAATVSITPTTTQNLVTGNNGTTLTASETNTVSRQWFYGTTSGGPYATATGNTTTSYIPNFATAGTYYVVCQSTNGCGTVTSNQVQINIAALQPPVITHTTPLTNTSSTTAQTTTAIVSSQSALSGALTLHYRIDGGTWATVSGTFVSGTLTSGSTYSFTIPGQAVGSLIEYYFTASNSAGTTRLPVNTDETLLDIVYYEYQINCVASASGTKTIAFQGFEFVSSPSWTFAIDNTNTTPTGLQNYPAHPSAVEWRYYRQGANGSLTADLNRNSGACMAEVYSGLPSCPDGGVYISGSSSGLCATYGSFTRGVYANSPVSGGNPSINVSRNGNYAFRHLSSSDASWSMVYFDDVSIPDASNATNIKVIAYTSSISTTTGNGADTDDKVRLYVSYTNNGTPSTMVSDITCGADWFLNSSNASTATNVSGSNLRWDFEGNTYNTTGTVSGTTTFNKLEVNVPNGSTNVRAMVKLLNDDGSKAELWAVDDIQIIADYPEIVPVTKRYYRSKHSGTWHNTSTWERASDPAFTVGLEDACQVPFYNNSDTIIIRNGHTVHINARDSVDQLMVEASAQLIYNTGGFILNNQVNSLDLVVEGTFVDNSTTGNGVNMLSGSDWKLGASGTFIKTNNSAVSTFRDNYNTGIATIPATANWIYKYIGSGSPITLTANMFYPNLYFESISVPYSWNSGSTILNGAAGFATVKGNMHVGTTGTSTVSVNNNNINAQPMLILGNLSIGAGSELTTTSYNGGTSSTHGYGTGFEVKGNVSLEGNLTINQGMTERVLKLSGTTDQTISGAGAAQVYKLSVNKPNGSVLLDRNFTAQNELEMVHGDIRTNTYVLELGMDIIQKGTLSYLDGFVIGYMKRWFNGTNSGISSGLYPFGVNGNERFATVEYGNAPTAGGSVTGHFVGTPMGLAGLPLPIPAAGSCNAFSMETTNSEGYWQMDQGNGLSGGNYDITLVGENFSGITLLCEISAIKRVGGGNWLQSGIHMQPTGTVSKPIVKRTGASGWSNWGFGGGVINPLPVELISFTGKCEDGNVKLAWSTASELNSERFIVERSSDLTFFEYVNEVNAAGNSNEVHNYQISVSRPDATSYFRLRQEDFDGAHEYFGPISVSCIENGHWNVYANDGLLYISADGTLSPEYTLHILDMNGKNLLSENIMTNTKSVHQTTDIGLLNTGMYLVAIRSKDEVMTYKIMVAY
jgi:hypothetical protein